jgi:hypothetical protein
MEQGVYFTGLDTREGKAKPANKRFDVLCNRFEDIFLVLFLETRVGWHPMGSDDAKVSRIPEWALQVWTQDSMLG